MPDAVGDERDESLRRGAHVSAAPSVDVDLAGDEEEVVTDAVQQDAEVQHPDERLVVAVGEQNVARHPRGHADEQHLLHAEPLEEPRHQEHEHDLRHLPHRHLPRRVRHADGVQERVRERVIELQRNAHEERADHEHRERSVLHQLQRVEPEHVAQRARVRSSGAACAAASDRTPPAASSPAAASCIGLPVASTPSVPTTRPATIQPIVPSTRTGGNSRPGIPHLPERQRIRERQRRHVEERVDEHGSVEWPEAAARRRVEQRERRRTRCSTASSRSVAKNRSAIMPTKNGEIIAASAVVP